MTSCHWRYQLKKVFRIKRTKFGLQSGLCFYCRQPMWHHNPEQFAQRHAITVKNARFFQATAEHLVARSDGGLDVSENIVAACWYCNNRRHRARRVLPPDRYAQKVGSRLSEGKWHGFIARNDTSNAGFQSADC